MAVRIEAIISVSMALKPTYRKFYGTGCECTSWTLGAGAPGGYDKPPSLTPTTPVSS